MLYEVKVNGNYNIVIKDINVYLSVNANSSVELDNETFESSNDIKRLLQAGIIVADLVDQKKATTTAETTTDSSDNILTDGTGAFVRDGRSVENPEDVFVATPKGVGDKIDVLPVPQNVLVPQEVGVEENTTTEALATEVETATETPVSNKVDTTKANKTKAKTNKNKPTARKAKK